MVKPQVRPSFTATYVRVKKNINSGEVTTRRDITNDLRESDVQLVNSKLLDGLNLSNNKLVSCRPSDSEEFLSVSLDNDHRGCHPSVQLPGLVANFERPEQTPAFQEQKQTAVFQEKKQTAALQVRDHTPVLQGREQIPALQEQAASSSKRKIDDIVEDELQPVPKKLRPIADVVIKKEFGVTIQSTAVKTQSSTILKLVPADRLQQLVLKNKLLTDDNRKLHQEKLNLKEKNRELELRMQHLMQLLTSPVKLDVS